MSHSLSRRDALKVAAATGIAASLQPAVEATHSLRRSPPGWIAGRMTGAEAVVEALRAECCLCVFGIPGAQENELWDTFKDRHLPYLLVSHESAAAAMADGYARSTGQPGVLCIVPGPGVTNALTNLGEALLDGIPVVCIAGDVARGDKYRPFQIHELPQVGLLRNVCKEVLDVRSISAIPQAIRHAFRVARAGEPGPVAVVIPYNLLIEIHDFNCPPLEPLPIPADDVNFQRALALLSDRRLRVGIYAGMGCMNYGAALVRVAEMLQAPVATSMSGKGVIPETHPLAVGWGYGPQATICAEQMFKNHVDVVLALGVRYSEVSTGFYSQPQLAHQIQVDINPNNLGRIMRTQVCVNEDAGYFLDQLLAHAPQLQRPCNNHVPEMIQRCKGEEVRKYQQICNGCGCDPMAFILTLRRCTCADALVFVDATVTQFWAAEAFTTVQPRTWFVPTNNQAMGWSIGAAMGAQCVHPGRQTVTITGDGCFLMGGMEIATAARAHLPVKFFILDDQSYQFMQKLQKPAYLRTTATMLAHLDYRALAQAWGVAYVEIASNNDLEAGIRAALCHNGPVLVRVVTDYGKRPIRWVAATRHRYIQELNHQQKSRFLARIGSRAIDFRPDND